MHRSLNSLTFALLAAACCNAVEEPPNVLFICIDDLRPELACYGETHMHTPNIDSLAATGRAFLNHFVQVPTCGASRFSMFTGQRPGDTSNEAFHALPVTEQSSPESFVHQLRRNGWYTASIGKVSHEPDGFTWLDEGDAMVDRARADFPEFKFSFDEIVMNHAQWGARNDPLFNYANGKTIEFGISPAYEAGASSDDSSLKDEAYPDALIAQYAIEKLREFSDDSKRFFLAVGFYRPHLPFAAPKAYLDLYPLASIPDPNPQAAPNKANPDTVQQSAEIDMYSHGYYHGDPGDHTDNTYRKRLYQHYCASVSYIDAQVGKLLGELDALGMTDNTIVVLWGDHGFMLDDYDLLGKHTLFARALRTPLIIRAPTMGFRGAKAGAIVESLDIYPTLVELCGLTPPASIDGSSLIPLLVNPAAVGKDWAYSKYNGNLETVRSEGWRLIAESGSNADLYNLSATLYEQTDVFSQYPSTGNYYLNALPVQAQRSQNGRYINWAQTRFPASDIAAGLADIGMDPDADELPNIIEYLRGSHPRYADTLNSQTRSWVEIIDTGSGPAHYGMYATIVSPSAEEALLTFEQSQNLNNWQAGRLVYYDEYAFPNGRHEYIYRTAEPLGESEAALYIRESVEQYPPAN